MIVTLDSASKRESLMLRRSGRQFTLSRRADDWEEGGVTRACKSTVLLLRLASRGSDRAIYA